MLRIESSSMADRVPPEVLQLQARQVEIERRIEFVEARLGILTVRLTQKEKSE
jgi:hypothetical protein